MKKNIIAQTHVEGYLYEHKLSVKQGGPTSKNPGAPFITGSFSIATDDACMNVIPIYFRYVAPLTKAGKANQTYNTLKAIIDGDIKSIMGNGKDEAALLRVDSSLKVNDFYANDGSLVSQMRNEGGFVHVMQPLELNPKEAARATFATDIVINSVIRQEANEETGIQERVVVKGGIFDSYTQDIKPATFVIYDEKGMGYFESLDASAKNPFFTLIKGNQVSQTVIKRVEEESAFGDAEIKEYKNTRKDWVITWATPEEKYYLQDDESTLSWNELAEKFTEREVFLANKKKQDEEYREARKNAEKNAINNLPQDEYNF